MKIQYCSDLHLEFPENRRYLTENPIQAIGDILILAGDILPFAINHKEIDFLDYVSENFEKVYWLPGNHEYYYSDISEFGNSQLRQIWDNIFVVDNNIIELDEINLIFTTLWTKINPENEFNIARSISDFQVIRYKGLRFLPEHYNALHKIALEFLTNANKYNRDKKTIVVTHHVPTLLNYPEQYKNNFLNNAFAVELKEFVEECGFDYWIFGHHHSNVELFEIQKTKLLTNQLGYVENNEHHTFRNDAIIKV